MHKLTLAFLALAGLTLAACNSSHSHATDVAPADRPAPAPGHFGGRVDQYWYQGKAELNNYDLEQIRYGEIHPGQVTMIFVSEPFLAGRQVKDDNGTDPTSTPALKTNQVRRFTTGIYDYSQMTSVFTPALTSEHPHTLKVTTSVQDWCGQTWLQMNYAGADRWSTSLRSYFEKEGDVRESVPADFLEDELFNRIRMGYDHLPQGTFNVVPANGYLVMMHKPLAAAKATLALADYSGDRFAGENLKSYSVDFTGLDRRVEIVFDAAAPYVIRGWTETYPSRGKTLTTVATLREQLLEPYWGQNGVADSTKRAEIGLGPVSGVQ